MKLRHWIALVALLGLSGTAQAMNAAVVAFDTPTATGTVDVTDANISSPKVAICTISASTADHTNTAHGALSVGLAANNGGTTYYSQGFLDQDAVATTNTGSIKLTTKALLRVGTASSPTTVIEADISSWLSNGIRLNFTLANGAAEKGKCLLLGGTDIEAKVLNGTFPGTGNNDLVLAHGISGAPTMVIAAGDSTSASWFSLGFWDGTNTTGLNFGASNGTAAGATALSLKLSTTLIIPAFISAADAYTVNAVDATNVTLRNTGNATGTRPAGVLAIRGVTAKTGFFTTDTATGSTNKITGLTVAPQAAIFLGTRHTTVGTTTSDAGGNVGLGFFANPTGATIQQASATSSEDAGGNAGVTQTKNQSSSTEAIRTLDITGAADYEGAVDAFTSSTISINTTNVAASALEVGYIAFGASATAPTLSAVSLGTATSTTQPVNYTNSDAVSTMHVVACKKGSTAPTVANVVADKCASAATPEAFASEATTGVADSVTVTGLVSPVYDFYAASTNATGNSSLSTFSSACLAAAAGKQIINCATGLTSISTTSPCKGLNDIPISPLIATGDIPVVDSVTTPGSFTYTMGLDCDSSYVDPSASRQYVDLGIYDASVGAMMSGTARIWYNNVAPIFDPAEYVLHIKVGAAMTPVDLCALAFDAEGDTLTGSGTPNSTGLVLGGTNSCTLSGTPTVENEAGDAWTFTVTDIAGATATLAVTIFPIDTITVPTCINVQAAIYQAQLDALFVPNDITTTARSDTIPSGYIISCSPAAGAEVDPFTGLVSITMSLGASSKAGRRMGIGISIGIQ